MGTARRHRVPRGRRRARRLATRAEGSADRAEQCAAIRVAALVGSPGRTPRDRGAWPAYDALRARVRRIACGASRAPRPLIACVPAPAFGESLLHGTFRGSPLVLQRVPRGPGRTAASCRTCATGMFA